MKLFWCLLASTHAASVCQEAFSPADVLGISSSAEECGSDIGAVTISDPAVLTSACFPSGNLTSNWVSVSTSTGFLVRRVEFLHTSNASPSLPSRLRLSGSVGAGNRTWFTSRSDVAWSTLSSDEATGSFNLPSGFEFTNLTLWPTSDAAASPLEFELKLLGCRSNATRQVVFAFNSSQDAIRQSFSDRAYLEREVGRILGSRIDLGRLLISSALVGSDLTVSVRVLPDSQSLETVDDLSRIISTDPSLLEALKSVQGFVMDVSTHMCYNKLCPSQTVCVGGSCVNMRGDVVNATTLVEDPAEGGSNLRLIMASAVVYNGGGTVNNEPSYRNSAGIILGGITIGFVLLILVWHFRSR